MSSIEANQGPLERNLIFVGLTLERGLIHAHQISQAFTLWLCDKNQELGEILFEMKILTKDQKNALDQEVEQMLAAEPRAGHVLSGMESIHDISEEVGFLRISELDKLLLQAINEQHAEFKQISNSAGKADDSITSFGQESLAPLSGPFTDRFQSPRRLPAKSGMGELWVAIDKELNRDVVIKCIKRPLAESSLFRGLFHLEAEVTGHLEHPNIPPVYSLGKTSESRDFFAMRYFKGKKFTEAIAEYHALPKSAKTRRRTNLIELLQSFHTACLAVDFAHNRGVIHCDLKPDNIMVGPYGETFVIDWGLVVVKSALENQPNNARISQALDEAARYYSPSNTAMTGLHEKQGGRRKSIGGTLSYMPPEQLQASQSKEIDQITGASDVFGLGATLYHLLTNMPPYVPRESERELKEEFCNRIGRVEYPTPRSVDAEVDKSLEAVAKKAMEADPNKRYESPRHLAEEIRRWLSDEPTIAYPDGINATIGRWVKKNLRTAVLTAGLAISSLLIGFYLIYREQMRAENNSDIAIGIAKEISKYALDMEPVMSKSSRYLEMKKTHMKNIIDRYDQLLETDPGNVGLLAECFAVNSALSQILRAEHNFSSSTKYFLKAAGNVSKLEKSNNAPDTVSQLKLQLKRDQALMEKEQGRFSAATTTLYEILEIIDKKKARAANTFYPLDETVAVLTLLEISTETGLPLLHPSSIKKRLEMLGMQMQNINWKNPQIYDMLFLKAQIAFEINAKTYGDRALSEIENFKKLNEIVRLYATRSLKCEYLPEPDYLFWVHESIMELVAYFAKKSPSVDLLQYCEQSLRFFEALSDDQPKIVDYRSLRVLTLQRKAALEHVLGRVAEARNTARSGLERSQEFLDLSPESYKAHFLAISALFQNLEFNNGLYDSAESAVWTLKAEGLIARAGARWREGGICQVQDALLFKKKK